MPREDAERWNARYRESSNIPIDVPRDLLVNFSHLLPTSGWGLDIATGRGANAIFLSQRGLEVVAIDISWVALYSTHLRWPSLHLILADLTEYPLPCREFDVILNFYYLNRSLFPLVSSRLKSGGLLFIETLTEKMEEIFPNRIDPMYLLQEGELYNIFCDWEILYYNEGITQGHSGLKAIASLVARKL